MLTFDLYVNFSDLFVDLSDINVMTDSNKWQNKILIPRRDDKYLISGHIELTSQYNYLTSSSRTGPP